jgi:uncharacterized membrane protein YhaH (DUF805 family)
MNTEQKNIESQTDNPNNQVPYQITIQPSLIKKNLINYFVGVFQKYATFSGRASRSEYFYFSAATYIVSIGLLIVGALVKAPFLYNLYSLASLVPNIALFVRRMHDTGKSGWFCLVPIYNLILLFTAGTQGSNAYGEDPWAPTEQTPIQIQNAA